MLFRIKVERCQVSTCFICRIATASDCQPRIFTHERFTLFSNNRDKLTSLVTEKHCLGSRRLFFIITHYFMFFHLIRHIMRKILILYCRLIVRLAPLVHNTIQQSKVTGGRIISGAPPYLIAKLTALIEVHTAVIMRSAVSEFNVVCFGQSWTLRRTITCPTTWVKKKAKQEMSTKQASSRTNRVQCSTDHSSGPCSL